MKNLFSVISPDFFKPLNSKYKEQMADCLLLIYNSYKSEISYGVDRESIVLTLTDYFSANNDDISFDDYENFLKDARSKAQGTINYLRNCGWLDFEEEKNYQQNVILTENAVPFIRTMDDVIRNEEIEYQGLISQIHAVLQNEDLYSKPYQFILKNVVNSTEQLVSSLKKLNISIKKHIDKQTKNKELTQILDLFTSYNDEIVSKALYRLKTSENIGRFRQSIKINLDNMLSDKNIMARLVDGYMEIEQESDSSVAQEKIIELINDVKTAFENLDKIILDIDRKNNLYLKNAAARAANNLLNHCFILKKKTETKQDYLFIRENANLFILFFDLLGYDINIDEDLGLISIFNRNGTGRLQFTKFESIMFLIFKLLYLEKRNDLSTYGDNVIISVQDVRDKYGILKLKNKQKLDKQSEQHIFSLFKRYNLIRNLSPDISLGETRIEIYPSILMAVPNEGINYLYEQVKDRIADYEEGGEDDDTDEETE